MQSLSRRVFYGWVVVAVCFVSLAVVFGVRLSFSVFLVAFDSSFGWSRAATAAIFSINMLTFAVVAQPVGWALDRWGPRRLFSLGVLFLSLGLFLSSRINSLAGLYVAYGVVTAIGVTILGLGTQAAVIANWFSRAGRRGTAMGLAFAGTGLGALVIVPGVEQVITVADWRTAYLALAVLAIIIVLPLQLLLMRGHPYQLGLRPEGADNLAQLRQSAGRSSQRYADWTWRQAAATPQFWLLLLAAAGAIGALRMLTTHAVAHMVDAGYSRLLAATLLGAAGAITALAFVAWGWLSDRIGRDRAYYAGSLCLAGAFLLMILLGATDGRFKGLIFLYPILAGLGEGSRSSLIVALVADTFPGRSLGAITSSASTAFALGAAVAVWGAGALYDVGSSYLAAFWGGVIIIVISALAVWLAQRLPLREPG